MPPPTRARDTEEVEVAAEHGGLYLQSQPWEVETNRSRSSLASCSSLLGEFQANKKTCLAKSGGQHVRNDT